jgi:putative nucleotidyltransferase with HDIG domain
MAGNLSRARPSALIAFIGIVIALGAAVIGESIYELADVPNPIGWIAFGALAILAASFALKVPGVPVYLSISDAFFITSALLFGPAPATVTIAADSLLVSVRRKNKLRQVLFNSTSSAVSLWCGVQTYYALRHQSPMLAQGAPPDTTMFVPLACLAIVYFLLNSSLTAAAVALSNGMSAIQLWRQHFAIISVNYSAATSAAFVFVVLIHYVGVSALAVIIPFILVCHLAMRSWLGRVADAQRHLDRVNQLYLSTVSALSTAIEAKDGVTSEHIHRVQAYAMGLSQRLGVNDPAMLQAIEAAALLHDAGKLAIPEHILNKPGKLTPDEFETMKSHVTVGADILSAIDFPYPVVPIVRAHHENWDGSGYPHGLRGDEIPIGARILSVVDCFDALTSDRPYRSAMTEAEALDIVVNRRGTMYDPRVVDRFLEVYREIKIPKPQPRLQAMTRNIQRSAAKVALPRSPSVHAPAPSAPSDDLLGFVNLARLTSGAPAVRDIGVFAWSQLRHLTPHATMALFTMDESKTWVIAQHVAGRGADRVPAMTIAVGERITGWVAANGRSMIDADAALDLGKGCEGGLRFALSIPLMAERGLVGVLTLYSPEPFGHQLALTVEMIGPHLARALTTAITAEMTYPVIPSETASRVASHRALSLVTRR